MFGSIKKLENLQIITLNVEKNVFLAQFLKYKKIPTLKLVFFFEFFFYQFSFFTIKGFSGPPPWLSNEIFIIKKIVRENNNNQVVQLDRDLYYNDGVIRV